jgi:hypothetical protein
MAMSLMTLVLIVVIVLLLGGGGGYYLGPWRGDRPANHLVGVLVTVVVVVILLRLLGVY